MKAFQQLFTRDGRVWGNAIIKVKLEDGYILETEFGNTTKIMSEDMVRRNFYTKPRFHPKIVMNSMEQWRKERERARTNIR